MQKRTADGRVLIVEDDEKTARIVRSYLVHEGYAVDIVTDGLSALRAVRDQPPDLVLLDVMLPELDGMDVCRELRRAGDVAIIMVTARTTERDKLAGLGAGADDYVTKPFSPRELVARVKSVLRRSARNAAIDLGGMSIDRNARQVRVHGTPLALTPTEYRVLDALATIARNGTEPRRFGRPRDRLRIRRHGAHDRRPRSQPSQEDRGRRRPAAGDSHGIRFRLRARRRCVACGCASSWPSRWSAPRRSRASLRTSATRRSWFASASRRIARSPAVRSALAPLVRTRRRIDRPALQSELARLGARYGAQIILVGPTHKRCGSSWGPIAPADVAMRPDGTIELKQRTPGSTRPRLLLLRGGSFIADGAGRPLWRLFVLPADSAIDALAPARVSILRSIWQSAALGIAAAVAVAVLLGSYIVKPIRELTAATKAMSEGRDDAPRRGRRETTRSAGWRSPLT